MAKTIAINPSWYWPDDVPRLLGVPPFFCERLMVERWSRRRGEAVALADADTTVTYAELWSRAQALGRGLASVLDGADRVALCGPSGIDGVVALIGALAARARPLLLDADLDAAAAAEAAEAVGAGLAVVQPPAAAPDGLTTVEPAELERSDGPSGNGGPGPGGVRDVREAALDLVTPDGWMAAHSHYSLVGGALSLAAFLALEDPVAWLCSMPLWKWEGLYSVLVPLYLGGTAVVSGDAGAGDHIAGAVDDHEVAYTIFPYDSTRDLSRGRPKRLTGSLKRNLRGLMLSVERPFAPGDRRKVRKALDVPVLTVFGLTESGPILASHPSWYIDESVGIPVTNVEVQPANPQTGEPLDTLWELLDYATMVIRAPLVMTAYEGPAAADEQLGSRLEEGWFKTGALASFDANGMMYLVEG